MQINFIGDIFGTTGYASHVKQLFNATAKQYKDVRIDTAFRPKGWQAVVNDAELEALNASKKKDRVDIFIGLPNQNRAYLNDSTFFCQFVVWEGTHIPHFWLKYLLDERIKLIFVPSKHVQDAIINTCGASEVTNLAIINKIVIVPHGVDIEIFKPNKIENDKFTFIANKGWTNPTEDRGGIQYIIKAFVEEFNKEDKVRLLLKINKSYNPNFNVMLAIEQLGITKERDKRPEVMITESTVDYKELPNALYWHGDVFVTATMGEAFNLPCIEAMACGLPVIATSFGGQTDYVNDENGCLVQYDLYQPKEIMYEETRWGKVNMDWLKKRLREFYTMDKESLKAKSMKAIETANMYQWQKSASILLDAIMEVKNGTN
jgi:glycosyltransferase involved in cell wall biosynthesis